MTIRGHRVLLDGDLAPMYGVSVRALNQAVKRNGLRFPEDFMFELTIEETKNLRSQIVISSSWGGPRYLPRAFTEQGVAMLSSVLRSPRAALVNVEIMRAFVRLRQVLKRSTERAGVEQELWGGGSTRRSERRSASRHDLTPSAPRSNSRSSSGKSAGAAAPASTLRWASSSKASSRPATAPGSRK